MVWVSGALAVGCLAVGLLHLLRSVARRDVVGEAARAAVGLGMAAMFSPLGDPVPGLVWTVVFVLCGTWFAALALRNLSVGSRLGGDAGHHVVGSAAMLFVLLVGHSEHAGHLGSSGGAATSVVPFVAIVLAGLFAWHVLRCADRLRAAGSVSVTAEVAPASALRGEGPPAPVLLAPRTAAAAHLVMGAATTAMLLGVV